MNKREAKDFVRLIAGLKLYGEEMQIDYDDAVRCMNELIEEARKIEKGSQQMTDNPGSTMRFSDRDRKLFEHVRAYAEDKYAAHTSDDVEIVCDGTISKSADDGFWVSARVHVRRSEARAWRDAQGKKPCKSS